MTDICPTSNSSSKFHLLQSLLAGETLTIRVCMCSWWKRKDKEIHHGVSSISDETLQQTREAFNSYDSNGNGTIDRDELAGLLRALDLVAFIPEVDDLVDDNSYKIVVHTAAHKEAGTDSKVSMTLYGENGDSGQRVLTTARNASFERGQISTLRITSTDLGKLTKLKIGHDNNGTKGGMPGRGWYLDKVVVSRKGMEPVTFAADRWLDTENAPDKQCEVTLTPGVLAKKIEKKVQKDDKVMYINPVYGPGGDISAANASDKLDPLGNPNRRVTIIGADNLINADMFDKSDPYCIVFWNGKRVGKTSTIDNTTYPRWNEDFTITLPESGEGFLRCELYDHDMFGGDDPLGTVEFKLGGSSNRKALLQTANYPFPDEKYTGFLTLKVDHAASRFASEGAHEFKDKWMKGMSYREHREKHVFEEWTRFYVMGGSAVLVLASLLMFIYSVGLSSCESNNSGYLSSMYVTLSPFSLLSGMIGIYGAFRVKKDVEDETGGGDGEAVDESGDDDGLQTVGQRILQAYNMCCVLIFVCLTIIIAETWILEVEESSYDTGCDDALSDLNLLMGTSFLCLIVLVILVYSNTLIVSTFEVLQTMAEFLALFLVLMGIFTSVVSSFVVKQTICLDISSADGWPDEAYIFLVLGIFGMLTVAVSFLGFIAAYQESMQYLLYHAGALGFLAVYGFVAVTFAGTTSATEFFTGENCKPMLTTLSEDFLWENFGAVKYDGRGMSRNQSDPNLSWMPVSGPSEAPSCTPKTKTQFYWEDNQNNPDYIDAQSGQVYDKSGEKVLYGCLNEPRACEHIAVKMSAYDMSIVMGTLWLMIIIIGSIVSSLWLRKQTSMVGHILIHHHAKLVFWVMKISLLACMIVLPFLFTGGECGSPQPAKAPPLESSLQVIKVAVEPFSSCFDRILNGDETDIDCGGTCQANCRTFQGCMATADCCTDVDNCDLICAGREPLNAFCFDTRCIDGQAASLNGTFTTGTCRDGSIATESQPCANGLVGVCVDRVANGCANGQADAVISGVDEGETGVDCGGPCDAKCPAGEGCRDNGDCARRLFCGGSVSSGLGQCYSCSDGVRNGDETDVDCGGPACPRCPDACSEPDSTGSITNCNCRAHSDCASGYCSGELEEHKVCVSHTNGRRDGDETGVDCGGANPSNPSACSNGECCLVSGDCASGRCDDPSGDFGAGCTKACKAVANELGAQATCVDGQRNFGETGTDCGGYECRLINRLCPVADCTLDPNAPQRTRCVIPCADPIACIVASSKEEGITSTWCEVPEDCVSGLCAAEDGGTGQRYCFSCSNGIRDGDEVGIDCGGSACGPCADGTRCITDDNCMAASACIYRNATADDRGACASRHNRIIDGGETGFDCGGRAVQEGKLCGIGQGCNEGSDCVTGNCDLDQTPADDSGYTLAAGSGGGYVADPDYWNTPIGGACGDQISTVEDTCQDGEINGDESDLDCGGLCATQGRTCDDGQRCMRDRDCNSGSCGAFRGVCVSCNNGILDGDETDIDCGGNCDMCTDGSSCTAAEDCVSGICAGAAGELECASCSNRVRDGDETGIDCGGFCTRACPIQQCMSDGARCGYFEYGISGTARDCEGSGQLRLAQLNDQPSGEASCIFATCNVNSDCQTGYCNMELRRCDRATADQKCQDGLQTIDAMHMETDVDCGAACAIRGYRCAGGQMCAYSTDCLSGICVLDADGVAGVCGGDCNDGVQNGRETDVDCGGECGRCEDGLQCMVGDDCLSGACNAADADSATPGSCTSCFNGIKDGDEFGADCGGSCDLYLCPLDSSCTEDSHCQTNNCVDLVCTSVINDQAAYDRCFDGISRIEEPDVDCGGPCLQFNVQCDTGSGCFGPDDCKSGICVAAGPYFQCVSCSDGQKNGFETDVDCGGRNCAPCPAAAVTTDTCATTSECNLELAQLCVDDVCVAQGRLCETPLDCAAGRCECTNEQCNTQRCVSCFDGWRNGGESDTDCGGQCARLCGQDDSCIVDSDCGSGYCRRVAFADAYGSCATIPTDQQSLEDACSNDAHDTVSFYESDIDCGGDCRSIGLLCEDGNACSSGADCTSGRCNSDTGECFSCADRCGGDCDACADGEVCTASDDCISGQCSSLGLCASCTNGAIDGSETGVDCGGDVCSRRCAIGSNCVSGSDCTTGTCVDSACVVTSPTETCSNANMDGYETDVDCGGAACVGLGKQCADNEQCGDDTDCLSGTCDTSVAIPTCVSCADAATNGQESDTDCGGDVCSPCSAAGGTCTDPLDATTCSISANTCREDSDCTDSCYCADALPSSCRCVSSTNGVKDGQEGGPDCGFRADTLCSVSTRCTIAADCSTGICGDTAGSGFSVCESPQPALPCDPNVARTPNDGCCADNTLDGAIRPTGDVCRTSCENGAQDGTETDMDCGGEFCRAAGYTCSAGDASSLPDMCVVSADCTSGACSLQTSGLQCDSTSDCTHGYNMPNTMCYMPAPRDGYCDVSYDACSDNRACATGAGQCIRFPGECVGTCSSCSDGRINGAETDIDCGGGPGGCGGCSIGQTCSCGISRSTGRCALHRDCSGGLECYAALPPSGLPSTSTELTRVLSAAQDSAVCIRPGAIDVTAQATTAVSSPGGALLRKISVAGSSPSGVENPCVVTANVGASGGVRVAMQNYQTRLAAFPECSTTSVTVTASAQTRIVGPFMCVDKVLSELRVDTTCDSIWIDGVPPEEDHVEATVLVTLSTSDAACTVGTDVARLSVSLVGRPVLVVMGVAINGDCVDNDRAGCADERNELAMSGVMVRGSVESCGDADADASQAVADCSTVPHPMGLPGGCCDAAEPFRLGTQVKSCPQLLLSGWNCAMNTVMLNMREKCANTCGFCPPMPPPPPPLSTLTPTVPVDAANTRVTAQGGFSLPIPLGMSGASDGNVLLILSKDGYVDTKVVVPVTNGNINVGHIVMVRRVGTRQEILGSCVDLYSTAAQRAAFDSSGTEMTATLYEGQVIYPALPTPYPVPNDPSAGTSISRGAPYRFSNIPDGTYTVICEVGGLRAARYVFSSSTNSRIFDPVAMPTVYTQADQLGGTLSGGEIMVSVDWQVMGDRNEARDAPDSVQLGRPDLDINGMFQATQSEACHVFFDYPRCGNMELLPDFRDATAAATPAAFWEGCGTDTATCSLLDGPVAHSTSSGAVSVPTEAMIIRQVRGAIYTFYVQYNANTADRDVLYPGVDPADAFFLDSPNSNGYLRVVEVNADVFAGNSRIAHTVGVFEVPGTTPYMRLFCIDATSGAPKVFSALRMSETPPEMCTSCPC